MSIDFTRAVIGIGLLAIASDAVAQVPQEIRLWPDGCLALFAAWKGAGKPAEIHIYDQVSGGFGMTKRGLPVDSWNDRLLEWLVARKLR